MIEDEFSQLFTPHVDVLYRMAFQWTLDPNDAEELVQELALKLVNKVPELRRLDQLRPWLIKVMYRIFIDLHRRKVNNPVVFENSLNLDESLTNNSVDQSKEPETRVDSEKLKVELIKELKKIEPNRATALFLFEVEGYSINEIAELQQVSEGTVKSRIFRAKDSLKKKISLGTFWDDYS